MKKNIDNRNSQGGSNRFVKLAQNTEKWDCRACGLWHSNPTCQVCRSCAAPRFFNNQDAASPQPWIKIGKGGKSGKGKGNQGYTKGTVEEPADRSLAKSKPKARSPVPTPPIIADLIASLKPKPSPETPEAAANASQDDDVIMDDNDEGDISKMHEAIQALKRAGQTEMAAKLEADCKRKEQAAAKQVSTRKRYSAAAQFASDCTARADTAKKEVAKLTEQLAQLQTELQAREKESELAEEARRKLLADLNREEGEGVNPEPPLTPQLDCQMRSACTAFVEKMQSSPLDVGTTIDEHLASDLRTMFQLVMRIVGPVAGPADPTSQSEKREGKEGSQDPAKRPKTEAGEGIPLSSANCSC